MPFLLTFRQPSEEKLVGIVTTDKKEPLTVANWFNGTYQASVDDYNDDHWPLKVKMVKLNNQFYYHAFNQIRVNGFVSGKDNFVFSENYIFSAFGDDLMKEDVVAELLQKAKVVQDTLKRKGIDLLLVYAPGKGMGAREYIEDKYIHQYNKTNHDLFVDQSRRQGIQYLDLYGYFEKLKGRSKYPLFATYAHHWTYYGECLAVDTIIKTIEQVHHTDLPEFVYDEIEMSDTARFRDADVLKSMNLWHDPPQNMKLAYPTPKFESDSLKNRTRVLTISDSYWWGPVYMGIGQACFAGGQFWYYNSRVVPSPVQGERIEAWQLDLKREVESNQVIMVLYSDGNLPLFGNNFIQDVYEMYTSPVTYQERVKKRSEVMEYSKQIRDNLTLLKRSEENSRKQGITLDSAIKQDAMKMAGQLK